MKDKILIKIIDTHTETIYYPNGKQEGKSDYNIPIGVTLNGLVIYKTDMDHGYYAWNIDYENRYKAYLINEFSRSTIK